MDKKAKVSEIMKRYRGQIPLRRFAEKLCEDLPGESISYQSIWHWEHGIWLPNLGTLMNIYTLTTDWRRVFAEELLLVINPGVIHTIKKWRNVSQT